MQIELINTGSELLLGRVLNTHQQFLCRALSDLGYRVARQTSVPDAADAVRGAVSEALARADLVITTGGLGPTSDDRTRDLIAELLGRKLTNHPEVLKRIERWFCGRHRPMPAGTAVQALVPEGATVLMNENGTAPGLIMEVPGGLFRPEGNWLVMLPGPPRELRPMFLHQVIPFLQRELPCQDAFVCHTLRTTGLGESRVEEIIAPHLSPLVEAGLEVGYCARTGEVDIRFSARGCDAARLVGEAERLTRRLIGQHLFGTERDELEHVIVRLLTERSQWLALAESCTGGFIANRITNVPGASAVLWGGCVSYADAAKKTILGVRAETLAAHGAVSEETAREMAEGIRRLARADFAIAVTGIAGPGGGTTDKPVGTVFIALACASGTVVQRQVNSYDRETFKYVTSQQGLEMLRRTLLGSPAL